MNKSLYVYHVVVLNQHKASRFTGLFLNKDYNTITDVLQIKKMIKDEARLVFKVNTRITIGKLPK